MFIGDATEMIGDQCGKDANAREVWMALEEWIWLRKAERAQAREVNELRLFVVVFIEESPFSSLLPSSFPLFLGNPRSSLSRPSIENPRPMAFICQVFGGVSEKADACCKGRRFLQVAVGRGTDQSISHPPPGFHQHL